MSYPRIPPLGGKPSDVARALNILLKTSTSGTGTASWGAIAGTLSDQTDLQAALDAKLGITDDASWGAGYKMLSDPAIDGLTVGDNTVEGSVTLTTGGASGIGGVEFDLAAFAGGGSIGLSANNRIALGTYGTITGWEFAVVPYVGTSKMVAMTGNTLTNAANDAAAAAAGIPVGGLYRNGSAVMIRVA